MNKTLFDLTEDYQLILASLEDGEHDDVLIDELTINIDSLHDKADNYAYMIKQLESEAEALEVEARRLINKSESKKKSIAFLKDSLKFAAISYGNFKTSLHSFSTVKHEIVTVEDESLIDDDFFTEKVTRRLSKTKLKESIKAGNDIPGAALDHTYSLRIK